MNTFKQLHHDLSARFEYARAGFPFRWEPSTRPRTRWIDVTSWIADNPIKDM